MYKNLGQNVCYGQVKHVDSIIVYFIIIPLQIMWLLQIK